MTNKYYHFVGETLWDGSPIPKDGEWLVHEGPLKMCVSGLHASPTPFEALQYAPGAMLCEVELDGEIIKDTDKVVSRKRKIVRRVDLTEACRAFARKEALSIIHLWDAPPVVREYLETGKEELREAARAAARAAAGVAAWVAAGAAAWAAARAAAWAATRAAEAAAEAAARAAAWAAAWDASGVAAWDASAKRFNELSLQALEGK